MLIGTDKKFKQIILKLHLNACRMPLPPVAAGQVIFSEIHPVTSHTSEEYSVCFSLHGSKGMVSAFWVQPSL